MPGWGIRRTSLVFCALITALVLSAACGGNTQAGTPAVQTPAGQASPPGNLTEALSQLDARPCPKGVSQRTWAELTGALGEALRGKAASELALEPPHGDAAASTLVYSGEGALLNWGYLSPGDYDQNGMVGLSDLVPLAVHFGESTGTGDPFPENSIGAVIDGDGNGELNLADIIAIALNFGVYVEGYRVYAADNTAAYPPSPDSSNGTGAIFIGVASMSLAVEPPTGGRKAFNYQVVPTYAPRYFWVRPTDGETDGAASNYVVVVLPPKQGPIAKLANLPAAETLAHIVWDASTSFDPDGVISRYEWDFNADGVYDLDSGQAPTAEFYYYAPGDYTCTVRVTDNDDLSSTTGGAVHVEMGQFWHRTDLTPSNGPYASSASPLFLIAPDGHPAVCYRGYLTEGGDYGYIYQRAEDDLGNVWGSRFLLPYASGSITGIFAMFDVQGRPAIIGGAKAGVILKDYLGYARADDPWGLSWPALQLFSFNSTIHLPLIIEGNPALLYGGQVQVGGRLYSGLCFTRSLDALGAAWGEPVIAAPGTTGLAVALLGGTPAASYVVAPDKIMYARAADSLGSSWQPPVVAVSGAGAELQLQEQGPQMIEAGGHPAITYFDGSYGVLMYVRALDAQGSAWGEPQVLDRYVGHLQQMTVVDGRPAIVYTSYLGYELCYIAANDPAGRNWSLPSVIDMNVGDGSVQDNHHTIPALSFSALSGRPNIAYAMSEISGKGQPVRFATYY